MANTPSTYYSHLSPLYVGVDCIIFTVDAGVLKVLLVRRDFEPEKGKWSLIGGFVHPDESVDGAARRVLNQLTGLRNVFIRQLGAFGEVDRDPGARVVSVAYFSLLNLKDVEPDVVEAHNAVWTDISHLPPLGFDHEIMISKALEVMKKNILSGSFAFNMLPPLFTLTQLQMLVETVGGCKLDKRNFRKRISENPLIEATGIIDKESSRRGAMLYHYIGE